MPHTPYIPEKQKQLYCSLVQGLFIYLETRSGSSSDQLSSHTSSQHIPVHTINRLWTAIKYTKGNNTYLGSTTVYHGLTRCHTFKNSFNPQIPQVRSEVFITQMRGEKKKSEKSVI